MSNKNTFCCFCVEPPKSPNFFFTTSRKYIYGPHHALFCGLSHGYGAAQFGVSQSFLIYISNPSLPLGRQYVGAFEFVIWTPSDCLMPLYTVLPSINERDRVDYSLINFSEEELFNHLYNHYLEVIVPEWGLPEYQS